jgi:hypothetical protein
MAHLGREELAIEDLDHWISSIPIKQTKRASGAATYQG